MTASARIKNQSISEVNQQGTLAMDTITQTIRNATSITSPAIATAGTQATLVVPTAANSPSLFNLSGTTLQIKEGTAAAMALTNSRVQATALTVKNLSRSGTSGMLQVSLTLKRTNPNNKSEYDYQKSFTTTVSLRP